MRKHDKLRIASNLVQRGIFFHASWFEAYVYCPQCQMRSPVVKHGSYQTAVDWASGFLGVFREIYK
jgi:hypothetical protein